MPIHSLPSAALLFISGFIALFVLILALPRRSAPGGRPLAWMMLSMMVWCWAYALYWISPDGSGAVFWLNVTHAGMAAAPVTALLYAAQLVQHKNWSNWAVMLFLLVEPVLTLIILMTDPFHQLFYGGLQRSGAIDLLAAGPWFWVNSIYTYGIYLITLGILVYGWLYSRYGIYRNQILISLAAIGFMASANFVRLAGINLFQGFDLTPALFWVSGLLLAAGMARYHLLELAPIDQDTLLDQMPDGVVIMDGQERIIDVNRAAARQLGATTGALAGRSLRTILENMPELAHLIPPKGAVGRFVLLLRSHMTVEVQISPLNARKSGQKGYLITWRDVTSQKLVEENLRRAIQTQAEQLSQIRGLQENLRQQAIHDPLTGLFNRRFLESALPKEIAQAERLGSPISFLMMDVDHFKEINDRYGHTRGDQALQLIAKCLDTCIRKGDWVARYGGEEFLAVLVDTDLYTALDRAKQILTEVRKLRCDGPQPGPKISISIGVSSFPHHGSSYDTLIESADQALYRAKDAGRNRVEMAQPIYGFEPTSDNQQAAECDELKRVNPGA